MSVKWERSKRWDDQHIPRWLWPVKAILRAFSSITLAVILLSLVALYGVLASVPIGMLALIPTQLLYAASALACITLAISVVLGPIWMLGPRRASRSARFITLFAGVIVLGGAGLWAWNQFLWPRLHYDPGSGSGLRLFATFADHYKSTTLRRLPGIEMSELEFYSWWPLRTILVLFVLNMIVATARRIEFTFFNLGVLTVHTGIILIALGSVFYGGMKLEGDMLLLAGQPGPDGKPSAGPVQDRFYDNTRVALYVNENGLWEQRPLRDVPRYNEYALDITPGPTASQASGRLPFWKLPKEQTGGYETPQRSLDVPVPPSPFGRSGLLSPSLRIVGYAPYAESEEDWVKVDPATIRVAREGQSLNPLRILSLYDLRPESMKRDAVPAADSPPPVRIEDSRPVVAYTLLPAQPQRRISDGGMIAVEYTIGMSAQRWQDLSEPLPDGVSHALVVEVPGAGFRGVFPVTPGQTFAVGDTGYTLNVKELAAEPPFPIITEGYKGATSSVAIVRVTPPPGDTPAGPFERWVYHRFPEINQDLLDEVNERGMPKRRDASSDIRIAYIDADQLQAYFDELPDGSIRALVREPGGRSRVVSPGALNQIELVPYVAMRVSERWAHAERFERPRPVPYPTRDKQFVGTHEKAMLCIEASMASPDAGPDWKMLAWVPFNKYLGVDQSGERVLNLPDGRELKLAFGRLQHRLPGFGLQMVDFEMISYDHRGAPRDYQSTLRVTPVIDGFGRRAVREFTEYEHVTRLNAPLRAPFHWDDSRPLVSNVLGRLSGGLSPNQFKFSQAGWDRQGWMDTQKLADEGAIPRPRASFTILGVGNNPGIHIIALGAVLMGAGIPWAFYVKPWLVRRRKAQIQEELKAGTYVPPRGRARRTSPTVVPGVSAAPAQSATTGANA